MQTIFVSADKVEAAIAVAKRLNCKRHWRFEDGTGGYLSAPASELMIIKLTI